MGLRRDVLSNYIGAGFSALVPIVALPWYLEAIGPKQWGLVGFISLLQVLLGMLDAGAAQAFTREFALRISASGSGNERAATLLYALERLYWGFSLVAAVIVALLAGVLARNWLQLDGLPEATGQIAIYGAAAQFAVQFPGSVYRSVLIGAQSQVVLNVVTIPAIILRHGCGAIVVSFWPSLDVYVIWNVVLLLLETCVRAVVAWRIVGIARTRVRWESSELRPVILSGAGMSGAVVLGVVTVQVDKIIASTMLSVEQFGYYAIASSVALGALHLINPVLQATFPRIVQLKNHPEALRSFNLKLIAFIGLLVACAAIVFVTSGRTLVELWLRSPSVVGTVYPLLSLLLLGTALNALYNVGYLNWIAYGQARRVLVVNGLALLVSVVAIPAAINALGVMGAAGAWIVINALGLVLSLEWLRVKSSPSK